MKKLGLFLVLILIVPAIAYAGDDPQFKTETTGSDQAGFSVLYSWPGEGKEPIDCTVTVRVKYSKLGDKDGTSEEFKWTHKIHNTGSGWAFFDGKSALDKSALLDVSILSHSCS
jgi:hypothetical protein